MGSYQWKTPTKNAKHDLLPAYNYDMIKHVTTITRILSSQRKIFSSLNHDIETNLLPMHVRAVMESREELGHSSDPPTKLSIDDIDMQK
jgi:hypothetical protein